MNRALVTGGTGFIGKKLIDRLIGCGWQVDAIVRDISKIDPRPGLNAHVVLDNCENVIEIVHSSNPTHVFHLASLFLSDHKHDDIPALIESNVLFGTCLLDAVSKVANVKFINTSTCWEYFHSDVYCPVNLYAATKKAFRSIIDYYVDAKQLHCNSLLLFDTYGLGDPRSKLVKLLLDAAANNSSMDLSPGFQKMHLVHIDDVIDAFVALADFMETDRDYGEFAVPSSKALSVRSLVSIIEEISGRDFRANWGERPLRDREVIDPWLSYKTVPGWEPSVDLKHGLEEIYYSKLL